MSFLVAYWKSTIASLVMLCVRWTAIWHILQLIKNQILAVTLVYCALLCLHSIQAGRTWQLLDLSTCQL